MAPDDSRRLRKAPAEIPPHLLEEWMLDYRFVREVERVERDGRAKSRGDLELQLGIDPSGIGLMRQGRLHAKAIHVARLVRLFNADMDYIMRGIRQPDKSDSTAPRDGKLVNFSQYPPLYYEYRKPAGWLVGPMPEADPRHYPADPTGATWVPHPLATPLVRRRYADYKAQHPELNLEQYERLVVPVGPRPARVPTELELAQNDALRAYLSQPALPDNPHAGMRWEAVKRTLAKLPVFLFSEGTPKAGKPNQRLTKWWHSKTALLLPEELTAVASWLGAELPQAAQGEA